MMKINIMLLCWFTLWVGNASAVEPFLAGGQSTGNMIHVDVGFSNGTLTASIAAHNPVPLFRPLPQGLAFDEAEPWSVLNGQAYNGQYGWATSGFFTIPSGASIWIKLISQSEGLNAYQGNTSNLTLGSYDPILSVADDPNNHQPDPNDVWEWDAFMTHNVYAIANPSQSHYSATYQIYFGDDQTAERNNFLQYGDAIITLDWHALPGDFNGDGVVEMADLIRLLDSWLFHAPEISMTNDLYPIGLYEFAILAKHWQMTWSDL